MNREAWQPGWWEWACPGPRVCTQHESCVPPGLEWFLPGALVHLSPPAELCPLRKSDLQALTTRVSRDPQHHLHDSGSLAAPPGTLLAPQPGNSGQ